MKTILRSLLAGALAASATVATIGVSAPVLASPVVASSVRASPIPGWDVRVAEVRTAGIDLTTAAGRALVDAKVRQAARRVCSVDNFERPKYRAEARACTSRAIAAASQQIAALITEQQLAEATPRDQTAQ